MLRMSSLLHKRIVSDLLSPIPDSQTHAIPSPQGLDSLPSQSSALLAASDELIAAVFPPQNTQNVATELLAFQAVIRRLHTSLAMFFFEPSIDAQLQALNLSRDNTPSGGKGSRKWFDTCFEQIDKAAQALSNTLEINTGS